MTVSATARTVAHQARQSMGFPRQEYWSGLSCPPPGDLPDPGIKPRSPALQADSLPSEPPGKPFIFPPPACPIFSFIQSSGWETIPAPPARTLPLLGLFLISCFSSVCFLLSPGIQPFTASWDSSVSVTGKGVMTMRP